ncbi:MAG: hypothetical protein MK085_05300 [Phycisphaerales bacterium]|nr:hypothetical protein [Phycisphaerales bacterium]
MYYARAALVVSACCLYMPAHAGDPADCAKNPCAVGCSTDWSVWNMYNYGDVPIWTNDDPTTPGHYDPEVPSPVMIYLHSNGPYGGSGVGEENFWARLWQGSYDGYDYYPGLENWPVVYESEDGGPPQDTGWIYVIPNGARDTVENATCYDPEFPEDWPFWRYWNATPNCCAYNWYTPGTYDGVRYDAPDHATYINNLIAWVKRNYNVDEDRVYIYGYSNGGYMCHRLACENGNLGYYGYCDTNVDPDGAIIPPQAIAAVGVYAGVTFMNPQNCNGTWPTNVLQTHDIGDQACLYDGGLDMAFPVECYGIPRPYPGALATVSSWIFLNQTNGEGEILEPIVPFDLAVPYSTAQVINWDGGRDGSTVQHWRGIFGSHGATLSNDYRNRLIEWFLENPRPDYPIIPNDSECPADLNQDGEVDGADLGLLFAQWGEPGSADFDGSGDVNGQDIGYLLSNWGSCPG